MGLVYFRCSVLTLLSEIIHQRKQRAMTKRQINRLARFFAASAINNALGNGRYSFLMTDEENETFTAQVDKIAFDMVKGMAGGLQALRISDLDGLVKHAQTL